MPFPVLDQESIAEKIRAVGVTSGDVLYVASFSVVLGNAPQILPDTIKAFQSVLGEKGTLVMPAFNWDYCSGKDFDVNKTPSQVGRLTEIFRTSPGVLRTSKPPWCTFCVWGKLAKTIAQIKSPTPFGDQSVLQFLYDHDAKYVLLGCSYNDAAVHVHWLEEKYQVPYRYWKEFSGSVVVDGKSFKDESRMFARRLDIGADIDSTPLTSIFDNTDKVKKINIGLGDMRCFKVRDYCDFMEPYFIKDKLVVLKPEFRSHFL